MSSEPIRNSGSYTPTASSTSGRMYWKAPLTGHGATSNVAGRSGGAPAKRCSTVPVTRE